MTFQNWLKERSDREVYEKEFALLVESAEPLGYDSIWFTEHHFTGYTMCVDPIQLLTYVAGRTKRIKLGTAVVVLPWHDPVRVTEQIVVLDNLSGGRVLLGLGRGAGKVEYDLYRIDMNQARERFIETTEIVLQGLEKGYCQYKGAIFNQPRAELRPAPNRSFRDRTYVAGVSPETIGVMHRLGVGMLIVPQKPWVQTAQEISTYKDAFVKHNGFPPPAPIATGWVFCDENADRAHELAMRYIGSYFDSVLEHYHYDTDALKGVKGYEYYTAWGDAMKGDGKKTMVEFFVNLHVWGTPEMCYEKILTIRQNIGADTFVGTFSYGYMPWELVARNFELFTKKVKPELQRLPRTEGWAADSA